MSKTIRTFIAIELPEKIISSIGNVQERMSSHGFKIRWVRQENIHLTLKFLGNIKETDIEKVKNVIFQSVGEYSQIPLKAKGVGVFPGIKRPRVIWIGISGRINPLFELQKKLEEDLEEIGFPKEGRSFKAHLTIGRVKNRMDPRKLGDTLKEFSGFESEEFVADRIILFKSDLKPAGAVYTKLVEAFL